MNVAMMNAVELLHDIKKIWQTIARPRMLRQGCGIISNVGLFMLIGIMAVSAQAADVNTDALSVAESRNERAISTNAPDPFLSRQAEGMAVLAVFAAIDYDQSCKMFFERKGYFELNPILGKYPTRKELAAFGILGLGTVYLLQSVMPDAMSRVFLDSVLESQQMNIEENVRVKNNQRRQISGIPIILSIRF